MPTDKDDVVQLLLDDHAHVEALLGSAPGVSDRTEFLCELVHTLITHEVAEEEIVYPEFRRHGGSEEIAKARIEEQAEAEKLLYDMEHLDPQSPDFTAALQKLTSAVKAHAKSEETEVFSWLKANVSADDRKRLGGLYTAAKSVAPTHPHPHAPDTPPGNLVLGPIVAIADRVRDAIRNTTART